MRNFIMTSNFYDRCGMSPVPEAAQIHDLSLIAGPCVFESEQHMDDMFGWIEEIAVMHGMNWVYKTSFDKANRTSADSFRGMGIDQAIYAFEKHANMGLEILTDVHEAWQCDIIPATIIQIPAFLCRQTDLIAAAAASGKVVNIKKGQFLSPEEMEPLVNKVEHFGGKKIIRTERGTSFGYNNLVVDMRSIEIMKRQNDYPIFMDCTHAVQSPGGNGTSSGGDRTMVSTIARSAVALGIAGVFLEVHQDPDNAPSDGANMVDLKDLSGILSQLQSIDKAVRYM